MAAEEDGVWLTIEEAPPMPRRPRIPGRAVGYVRVSTDDQVREGWSLDAQRHRIAGYCQAHSWDLVEVYADEGVSAAKERPEFDRMVAEVLADGVSHVVALKLDRLGRSAKGILDLYDKLERKGVGLVCIQDGIDTSTPTGRLLRTILAAVAEFERDVISERTKIGMAEAKRRGATFGKRSALSQEVVARIVGERAQGTSLPRIAEGLNRDGVPPRPGGPQVVCLHGAGGAALPASTRAAGGFVMAEVLTTHTEGWWARGSPPAGSV